MLLFFVLLPSFGIAQQPKLFINELVAVPHKMIHDPRGEYDDWVEIYNAGDTAVCLAGYYLTDDLSKPKKVRVSDLYKQFSTIPPKGHLLLWFDKGTGTPPIHMNLKLSSSGEQVGLFTPDGKLVDSVTFGPQKANLSYGRLGDGQAEWGFLSEASPAASNTSSPVVFAPKAQFSLPGGFYTEPVSISLSGGAKNDTIRYTLDGTTPSRKSGFIYEKPITIDTTLVLRATIYGPGKRSELPVTHSYFIGDPSHLPVLSLATDSIATLLRTDAGTGFRGENLMHMEFFENNQIEFHGYSGFRLQGLAIRYFPQKSLAVRMRSEYGMTALEYPLFPQKPGLKKLHDFSIRTSGNDNTRTLFRDALMHSLISEGTHNDYLAYRPVVIYVNGKYWGIHNLREKISRYYLKGNYPKKGKKVDLLEWNEPVIQGNAKHFKKMFQYAETRDLTVQENFDTIASWIDLDNFIDYWITESFYGNADWPMANIKYWRPKTEDGKWRWILFDLDVAYNLRANYCKGHHNGIAYILGDNNCNPPHFDHGVMHATTLFRALIKNPGFKERFISRYADLLNTNFSASKMTAHIKMLHDSLAPEMPRHIKRWRSQRGIRNMESWEREVGELYLFADQRPDTIRKFMTEAFDLGAPKTIAVGAINRIAGEVSINSITPPLPFDGVYFENVKVQLVAKPKPGYVFREWKETRDTNPSISIYPNGSTYTAVFVPKE